jgi:hypothetical protein
MADNQNKKIEVQNLCPNKKLEQLIEYLPDGNRHKFSGYIKINFNQGHIGRIEKFEEIFKN